MHPKELYPPEATCSNILGVMLNFEAADLYVSDGFEIQYSTASAKLDKGTFVFSSGQIFCP